MEILVATQNAGKVREISVLLEDLPVTLKSLKDFPDIAEPEETGSSFVENAILKAEYYSLKTGLAALADDSGLEVKALNNAPGIFSARYAGLNSSDAAKIEKLLTELDETGDKNRLARFACAAILTNEKGEVICTTTGICAGKIAFVSAGKNGFGYDPIFIPQGFSETFGELSNEIKQEISHRAQAIRKIIAFLRGICAA